MTFNIKIANSEEAQKLNAIASKYVCDIWVHGKQGQADAKSLLGLMLMTMENEVKLVVEDTVDEKTVKKDFAEFIVE